MTMMMFVTDVRLLSDDSDNVCHGWVFTKVMTMVMFVTDACLRWWPIVWKRLLLAKFASE